MYISLDQKLIRLLNRIFYLSSFFVPKPTSLRVLIPTAVKTKIIIPIRNATVKGETSSSPNARQRKLGMSLTLILHNYTQ